MLSFWKASTNAIGTAAKSLVNPTPNLFAQQTRVRNLWCDKLKKNDDFVVT